MTAGFADEDLNRCIGCGLCLGSCPTYRVTGLETANPRGRIEAMRAAAAEPALVTDDSFGRIMEECVQCRACEAVCPSQVPFGRLVETARTARHRRAPGPRLRRLLGDIAFRVVLPHRAAVVVASVLLSLAQLVAADRLLPRSLRPAVRVRLRDIVRPLRAPSSGRPVWFFRGCVMDVWMRPVHQAAVDVLEAAGVAARWPADGLCCGAMHAHQGRHDEAVELARRVMAAFPGDERIVVDSAGCGAALKEYGALLGTPEARAFSARVVDFSEVEELLTLRPIQDDRPVVGYQHACHLRNVQKVVQPPLRLLTEVAGLDVREGDEPGVCCGAGGAYAAYQPALAAAMRDRKAADLAGLGTVVTTNPGCHMHLAAAGLPMRHLAEVLADRLGLRRT